MTGMVLAPIKRFSMGEGFKGYLQSLAADKTCGFVASCLKGLFYLLSLLYGLGVKVILACYELGILKTGRLDVDVISVGNVTLGGTGKTPVVEMVASILQGDKQKVAILSRGYGRKIRNSKFEIQNGRIEGASATVDQVGDEPLLLSNHLPEVPILVGTDKLKTGQEAIARYGVGTILLDDGFQHWRLKRDLDIVVIDSANPFGNGKCLPRGILREPISSLKRADVVVLTKTDVKGQPSAINLRLSEREKRENLDHSPLPSPPRGEKEDGGEKEELMAMLNKVNPGVLTVEAVHQPRHFRDLASQKTLDLSYIRGQRVCCLSGIGDPTYFERILRGLGAKVCLGFRFLDHHRYAPADLEKIYRDCRKEAIETVVTTEKDAVRMKPLMGNGGPFFELEILVLAVQIRITKNLERFTARLLSLRTLEPFTPAG